jgi:hypothetical protein
MQINQDNYLLGNDAMASVLLLYYQIVTGGGISHDETVYIEHRFNAYEYLNVEVDEQLQVDISQKLIREGAVVFLLCDLNDMIAAYDDSYLDERITQKIIKARENGLLSSVPDAEELIDLVTHKIDFDYEVYKRIMDDIYTKYVLGTFRKLSSIT